MLETFEAGPNFRIVLQPEAEGIYVFVFERENSGFPERDYLQESVEIAKQVCLEDFGTPFNSWHPFDGERIR